MEQLSEVEHLRFQVSELKEALGASERFPILGLSRKRAELVGLLMKREFASAETIYKLLYSGSLDGDTPEMQIIYVMIAQIRKRLRPHGIEIKNSFGNGYWIDKADKEKLRSLTA